MSEIKYLNKEFEEWLKKRNTKIAKRCLKALDREIVLISEYNGFIEVDKVSSWDYIPNYLYKQIKLFIRGVENERRL